MGRSTKLWRQVYFLEAEGLGAVKIGSADNVGKRLADLQTGCPVKLTIRGVFHTDDAPRLESGLHRSYAHLRIQGEWFRMDEELADLSLGAGEPDDTGPRMQIVYHPHKHPHKEADAIVPSKVGESIDAFAERAFKVYRALFPENCTEEPA